MKTIKRYQSASVYFAENQSYLMQTEINNNLIIGLIKSYENVLEIPKQVFILTVFDGSKPKLTFFKNSPKGVLAGNNADKEDCELLIEYLQNQGILLEGLVGDEKYANLFMSLYPLKISSMKKLISHELSNVNEVPLSNGLARLANESEIDILAQWFFLFQEEENLFPQKTAEGFIQHVQNLVNKSMLYVWEINNEIVSMATIVRETPNFQIVGAVYTPVNQRKNGYATSLVHFLSQLIVDKGKKAGLFTNASNPTSNKIYQNIGYNPNGIVSDVEFERISE
jgi:predicted GNAT family acetyltransferase